MPAAFRVDPEAACDACGCRGAFRFDGETLCGDCYAKRGATCCADKPDRPACAKSDEGD